MKRDELLKKLRELYIKGELSELKRVYMLGGFLLTNEDRRKIDAALKTCPDHKLIAYALKMLCGRIV